MSLPAALGFGGFGVLVGAFGTLIGAGGGFLLLPLLIFLYPHDSPALLTGISLSVVFANALSGSIAYARLRRIDLRAGLVFAAAGLPGAILGAFATSLVDRRTFDPVFGGALMVAAVLMLLHPHALVAPPATRTRTLVESGGTVYRYAPRTVLGAGITVGVGFASSFLGIGGGIIHVPVMVYFLGFPIHVATATSHFVMALLVFAAVVVHAGTGTLLSAWNRIVPLACGVLVGAQAGAWLSSRVKGTWILRSLALALASVGLRLLLAGSALRR